MLFMWLSAPADSHTFYKGCVIMSDPKNLQRIRIIWGVSLMLVGILVAYLLIKYQYDDCAHRWLNNLDGFGKKYRSVWDCFISRSKGAILISLLLGSIPVSFGWRICIHR